MKKLAIASMLVTLTGSMTGCTFTSSLINGAEDSAGRGIGNAVGNKIAADQTRGMPQGPGGGGAMSSAALMSNPAFLNAFMTPIFMYAFNSGGYDVTQVAYKPGQYTRWDGKGRDGKGVELERAYLGDDAKGNQWWKIKWTGNEEDGKKNTIILEGLLNPKEQKFVRMRAKFPEDKEPNELPVTENTYYAPPTKLSQESVEGATKGVESVQVPAGTFKANHVVFGGFDGTHEWWLSEKVPGGTVKQMVQGKDSDSKWEMDLTAYGSDAKSELGSIK